MASSSKQKDSKDTASDSKPKWAYDEKAKGPGCF